MLCLDVMPPPADYDSEELLVKLIRSLRRTAERATPDFLQKMPDPYFLDTDPATVLVHLTSVVAARASGVSPRMILQDPEQRTWTFVHQKSYRGLLSDLIDQLPRDQPLSSAKVHTATDGGLVLDVFRFGEASRFDPDVPNHGEKLKAVVAYARGLGDETAVSALPSYVAQCSADFVMAASPLRIYETWCLARTVEGTEDVACSVAPQADDRLTRISIVAGNADTRVLFERYVRQLGRVGLDITRAYLDVIRTDADDTVSLIGFVVRDPEGALDLEGEAWAALRLAFKRLRWVDDQVLERLEMQPALGLLRAEVLVALTRLVHAVLARDNPFAFTRNRLLQFLDRGAELGLAIADLFLERFARGASLSDDKAAVRTAEFEKRIESEIDGETDRRYWKTLVRAVRSVERTNVDREDRYGLAMMLDPSLFEHPEFSERPFGVIFVHADKVDAFHVRFEDLARGGVRAVCPRGSEQYVLASERLYEEAYDLAYAQQLKNKDIPEGGSKAVVLVEANAKVEAPVKAFVDGVLDLLLDRTGGATDLIYLGPDENISPALIDWVVNRADHRGYPQPSAFMSSKPGAGINHKAYGVTSEGVTVFLEEALKAVGIDPRQDSFTVKLTGGPDGDVAGNQIKILHREFGERARIVGIADGSGAAWDPAGLEHAELLRLVDTDAPIARFSRERLSADGGVVGVDEPEGLRRRNRLHFEVVADAFVPAGGRPQSINGENWSEFLKVGLPSSRVIVEGANLFITPEARRHLSAAGVLIIKDSTANKCGVICSSYEVAASMLLAADEFVAQKPRFVAEVIDKLRELARSEAVRLLTDHAADKSVPLPDRAVALSRAILRATNAIAGHLRNLSADDRANLAPVAAAHLPATLIEAAGPGLRRLPLAYRDRIVAARLSSRIVYREGVEFVDRVPEDRLGRFCVEYFRVEQEAEGLVNQVIESRLPGAPRIAELLRAGGARAALLMNESSASSPAE